MCAELRACRQSWVHVSALQIGAGNPGARDQAWDPKSGAWAGPCALFGSQAWSPAPGFPGPYGPWPLGFGLYSQGRNMTLGEKVCRLRNKCVGYTKSMLATRKIMWDYSTNNGDYANNVWTMCKICRLREEHVDVVKNMSTLLLGQWVTVR